MSKSLHGLNRCVECNKFASWDDLEIHEILQSGWGGTIVEDEYMTHKHGKGCKSIDTMWQAHNAYLFEASR